MMESPLLEMHLRSLHLSTVLANYRRLLGEHAEPLPYLSDLISLEAGKRHENGVRARIAAAHFPTIKTIESFDFALQPELPKAKLLEHFDGAFVEGRRNPILSGPPGVGKSHILSALGLAMYMRGYRLGGHFKTAHPWAVQNRTLGSGDVPSRLAIWRRRPSEYGWSGSTRGAGSS